MVFVRAEVGPPIAGHPHKMFTVRYFDAHRNVTVRSGGTRAWRCNNPGNLIVSPYSMGLQRRSIGCAGDHAFQYPVYPDYETGHEALIVMLKGGVYAPLTLEVAMKRYEFSNPVYVDTVVSITGLDSQRTIGSLGDEEFEKFWRAIERIEKWEVGREDFIQFLM